MPQQTMSDVKGYMDSDKSTLVRGVLLAVISAPVLFVLLPGIIVHYLPAAIR